jgi:hypothetical protein
MFKLLTAIAALLSFAAVGTALTAEFYFDRNSPPLSEASIWEARQQITDDVIDGHMSLLEAAAAFRELNNQSPLVVTYPGSSEEERACEQVIAWVRAELEGRAKDSGAQKPGKGAAAVLTRLKAELKATRGKDGKVHLEGETS